MALFARLFKENRPIVRLTELGHKNMPLRYNHVCSQTIMVKRGKFLMLCMIFVDSDVGIANKFLTEREIVGLVFCLVVFFLLNWPTLLKKLI